MMTERRSSRGNVRSFNPARLTLARERRGLTKQNLADECGITRRTVTAWEAGEVEAPPTALLGSVLGFPESFFYIDDPAVVTKDGVTFRALKSMTARQMYRVLAASALAVEFSDWIDDHYKTPPQELPDLSDSEGLEPAVAAATVRSMWAPSQSPIKGFLSLLERKGVRVFALPMQDREVDAFSFWRAGRPFVFLNTGRTAERIRFDLAHELGHLLLHRGDPARRSRNIEQQAQDFASSLLIPADALYAQVVGSPTFDDVFTLKRHWRVSAVAMVQRLWHLGIISEWHYRTWMIELSERGFRTSEPGGIRPEGSMLLRQLFSIARQDGWSNRRIASALAIPSDELESMIFGLVIAPAPSAVPAFHTETENTLFGRLYSL